MSAPPPPPPPQPRGHDSSSSSSAGGGGGGGGGGGYPPPPPPPPLPTPTTTNTSNVVVGPNKLTANNDHNYIHHHHQQHPSQTPPPFDQIATGAGHHHHQQPPLLKLHNRNEPPPPQQHSTTTVDRWSTMLPMYHHHHHHHRPPLDSHSLPLETTRPEFNTRPADKDTFTGTTNTKYDHRGRDKDAYYPEFKEGYAGPAGINWKDSKDHYRVPTTPTPPPPPPLTKRAHTDTTSGAVPNNSDTWDALRSNLHTPVQEVSTVHERDYVDSQEAVAENRVDSKGEDRNKDKDRKRKDLKHRDWGGERDKDRIERRTNLQLGSGSAEGVKEPPAREDDRWDREKKDPSKDREKSKEMEKDPVKRETWNGGPEKDGLNSEKEPSMDISGRTPERETSTSEQKKPKDHDGWRTADREGRERRKERDGDVEPERPEKRSRCYDKESDDGCADPDGGTEKDREGFSYGVQQRKRMLRPRGSPQVGNREPRFRSRAQDNEGAQGKPEVSTVVYRVGECMQELIKLWKEYESSQADKNGECSQASPTLEIRIPAEFITATNRQVRGGQLWGTDVYTDDSDLVAVLMHTGYCRPTASPPPPAIQELRATVRVLPPQDCYTSTLRNNVRSRAWGAAIGCSYRVEHCCIFKKGGGTIDLEPCLTHTSTVEPTLAPVAVERTMTTRAAASNALRQQRFVREVTIQYNLCNEPWIKYSLSVVADKGLKKPLYTSARLKKGEVLYLETHTRRFELCFSGEKMVKAAISSQARDMDVEKTRCLNLHSMDGEKERGGLLDGDTVLVDIFRWSRCKRPLPQNLLRSSGIPLPSEHLEVLEENLDWEDIQWSQTGVFIAGKEYALARLHFMSPN